MSTPLTLVLLAFFVGLAFICRWRGARPLDMTKGPRLIPWGGLMMICLVGCLLMLAHLFNLFGVETGRR